MRRKVFDSPKRTVSLASLSVLILLLATLCTSSMIFVKASPTTITVDGDPSDWLADTSGQLDNTMAYYTSYMPCGWEYVWRDEAGDDTGNGTYTYPTNTTAYPPGIVDILEFRVTSDLNNLYFLFKMGDVVNPAPSDVWGFKNIIIVISIDTDNVWGSGEEWMAQDAQFKGRGELCWEHQVVLKANATGDSYPWFGSFVVNHTWITGGWFDWYCYGWKSVEVKGSTATDYIEARVPLSFTDDTGASYDMGSLMDVTRKFAVGVGFADWRVGGYDGSPNNGKMLEVLQTAGPLNPGGGDANWADPNVFDMCFYESKSAQEADLNGFSVDSPAYIGGVSYGQGYGDICFSSPPPPPTPPEANFTETPPPYFANVTTINFDASSSVPGCNGTHCMPIVSYVWDFGDGSTGTGLTTTHIYTEEGSYTVILNVTDSQGLWDTASTTVNVSPLPPPHGPTAHFTFYPSNPLVNGEVSFDASDSLPGFNGTHPMPIVSYDWDFGDGATDEGVIVNHVYMTEGTYTVTLNVTDSQGFWNSTSSMIFVKVPPTAITVDGEPSDWLADTSGQGDNTRAYYKSYMPCGSEYVWKDEAGDDTGNGTYTYPTNTTAYPAGIVDILEFRVTSDLDNLYMLFKMGDVVNPPPSDVLGFKDVVIVVAIDTDSVFDSGEEWTSQDSHVRVRGELKWEWQVVIKANATGEWEEPAEDKYWYGPMLINSSWFPFRTVEVKGSTTTDCIEVRVPLKGTSPTGMFSYDMMPIMDVAWKFVVMVGFAKWQVGGYLGSPNNGNMLEVEDTADADSPGGGEYDWADPNIFDMCFYESKSAQEADLNGFSVGSPAYIGGVSYGQGYEDICFSSSTPPTPPEANFTETPPPYFANVTTINFDASSSVPGWNGTHTVPIANYTWDFDDETSTITTTNPTVTHIYATEGTYTVSLTVMCEDDPMLIRKGLTSNSTSKVVTVLVSPPTVSVYPSYILGDVNDTFKVYINIEEVKGLHAWSIDMSWNSSVLECLSFTFNFTFFGPEDQLIHATGTINNTAGNIQQYAASFFHGGPEVDGSGTLAQGEFRVLTNGSTSINLMIDLLNSSHDSIPCQVVNGYFAVPTPPHGPAAHFNYSPNDVFVNVTTTFDASASSPGWTGTVTIPIANYTWDFGDGPNVTTTNPTVTHTYTAVGNYTITLSVTDNKGNRNTITQTTTVNLAEFSLVTLYQVHLDLKYWSSEGAKLTAAFYTYDGIYQSNTTIQTISTPTWVELSPDIEHPQGKPIEIVKLVLTDDSGNVLHTVISYAIRRSDLMGTLGELDHLWTVPGADRSAIMKEYVAIDGQWSYAPT